MTPWRLLLDTDHYIICYMIALFWEMMVRYGSIIYIYIYRCWRGTTHNSTEEKSVVLLAHGGINIIIGMFISLLCSILYAVVVGIIIIHRTPKGNNALLFLHNACSFPTATTTTAEHDDDDDGTSNITLFVYCTAAHHIML